MNESQIRQQLISKAEGYLGAAMGTSKHKEIVDIYNSHKPLARGYALKYTDAWCSGFVSAMAIACKLTDIIPTEVGCPKHVDLFKKMGRWKESDSYVPKPGDIMFYDWDDSGSGDNTGSADHVGIVTHVDSNVITVIEGNMGTNSVVGYRTVKVNGKYIRGYGIPNYASKATVEEVKPKEDKPYKPTVKEWQKAAIADGYKFPKWGADGVWGDECVSVATKAQVKRRVFYTNKHLTRMVQLVVGVEVDGLCGPKTVAAIKAYQKKNGLTADGIVGVKTWKKILGVK